MFVRVRLILLVDPATRALAFVALLLPLMLQFTVLPILRVVFWSGMHTDAGADSDVKISPIEPDTPTLLNMSALVYAESHVGKRVRNQKHEQSKDRAAQTSSAPDRQAPNIPD